jgi:hypothetical protein
VQLVVADTGPINYLILIGHIGILPALFEKVILPAVVRDESGEEDAITLAVELHADLILMDDRDGALVLNCINTLLYNNGLALEVGQAILPADRLSSLSSRLERRLRPELAALQ